MKSKPIRHPDSTGCNLRENESHFGRAAGAVFSHAAYTFKHFVKGDDYKWIALACLYEAELPTETLRAVAAMTQLDLQEETLARDECCPGVEHSWVIRDENGHDHVHCARCMRCLSVEAMLHAYVKRHGGTRRRG
jgi:hypothetical protein